MHKTLNFSAVILIRGVNPHVLVSAARAAKIQKGWRKPLPVKLRANGKPKNPWRINMMPVGDGRFYLYLHGKMRKASKTKVGDRIKLEVIFDPTYKNGPLHPMPPWFKKPLSDIPEAKRAWVALPPSRKKEVLRYLSRLKSPDAQERNLDRALRVLSGKKERFMGRTWVQGK